MKYKMIYTSILLVCISAVFYFFCIQKNHSKNTNNIINNANVRRGFIQNSNNHTIIVNGKTYSGSNVEINGGNLIIDNNIKDKEIYGAITITVNGDVQTIETITGDVKANNVYHIEAQNGSVHCQGAFDVTAINGDVYADNIYGNASTTNGNISTN